jgi:hypothetical protein
MTSTPLRPATMAHLVRDNLERRWAMKKTE